MGKLTVDDLKTHLQTYKDAVVLIGNNILDKPCCDNELLNNKTLRRNPNAFWSYFKKNIYIDPTSSLTAAQEAVVALHNKGLVKNIVNLTNDARLNGRGLNIINLHGTVDSYKCTCKLNYTDQYVMSFDTPPFCEVCGKALRPNILLAGENYYDDQFHALKHLLLETHTVFIIGLDWNEDAILNLIADYSDMKEDRNLREEEQRMLVTVGDSHFFDINEVAKFEFLVKGDINEAMKRLLSSI